MVPRKKKYESGEAANFMSRKQAMRKLQLNLKDFRRLCILKGIHPREPRNRKRAQKGDMTKIQTMFHEKDIRFLLHEPIVWKFRDFKVFLKKVKKAKDKGELNTLDRLKKNKPKYELDHIVRERYPTFVDAVRDLEDPLCLAFLYSTFPKSNRAPSEMIKLCRKLTVEFMHYVIEAKALRKVFVSIKGYYFQAEIMGQTVTWISPHPFSHDASAAHAVDVKLMSIFVEFYTTMLGFINFRLYHNLNLRYPPMLTTASISKDSNEVEDNEEDRIAALNSSLKRTVANMDDNEDDGDEDFAEDLDKEALKAQKEERERLTRLKSLFKGLKVYLSREVPREQLVFMIRAFGGEVCWMNEDDKAVTHQICDRPKETIEMKHIGRDYIQPQWVFDSINRRELLPVDKYFIGVVLPPHLSPFAAEGRRTGDYVPPEEDDLFVETEAKEVDEVEDEDIEDEESEDEEGEESDKEGEEKPMIVEKSQRPKVDHELEEKKRQREEFNLRKMDIKGKHKGLYRSMMKSQKRRVHQSKQLEWKRKNIIKEQKMNAK